MIKMQPNTIELEDNCQYNIKETVEDRIGIIRLLFLKERCDTCLIDLIYTPMKRAAKHTRGFTERKIYLCNKHGIRAARGNMCNYCKCAFKKKDYRKNSCSRCGTDKS